MRKNDRSKPLPEEDTMKIKCIHYGDTTFNKEWFKRPTNRVCFNKPTGGMWCSPVDAEWGWKEWCESEDFYVENLKIWFTFTLESNKILIIDSPEDLNKFIWTYSEKYGKDNPYPDFVAMSKIWDAIFLTDSGIGSTRFSTPYDLYGWDCESILILNPDCVKNVRSFGKEKK